MTARGAWSWVATSARSFWHRLISLHDTPESIARGVALGAFVAMTPTIGAQMPLAAGVCFAGRGNIIAGMVMTWTTNVANMPIVYWADYRVGRALVGGKKITLEDLKKTLVTDPEASALDRVKEVGAHLSRFGWSVYLQMMIGGMALGVVAGAASYPITLKAVRRFQTMMRARKEEDRRLSARVEAEMAALKAEVLGVSPGRRLVLASASPRRHDLLAKAGFQFEVAAQDVDETPPAGLSPVEVARALARRKALAAVQAIRARGTAAGSVVLGADTLVALGDEAIGKPSDREDARRILARLAGTTHRVVTALCLVDVATGREAVDHAETAVRMRPMTAQEIAAYVESGEADGKAGAYAIQETGDRFVEATEGSWTNVVGMPVELFSRMWETFGRG